MTDPREIPGFKAKHISERTVLLLGAILDALKELKPQAPKPILSRSKAD
jgi:hypothetical protein